MDNFLRTALERQISAHRFPEATMSNRDYVFQGKHTGSTVIPWLREYRRTSLFILLAAALLAAATWIPSRAPIMQELPASIANAEAPGAGEAFHYYPGQYVNQASEASEHIQAF